MLNLFRSRTLNASDLLASQLHNQDTFYKAFLGDLSNCTDELVIESPFITSKRMEALLPILARLARRRVRITVNTRHPQEHNETYQLQAEKAIAQLQALDIVVLYTAGHHRKLAIIDRAIAWEGSLNILSHNDTCEIMRRTLSTSIAQQLINFIGIQEYLMR